MKGSTSGPSTSWSTKRFLWANTCSWAARIAAEALLKSVSRMIPGVVGNPESVLSDSFYRQDQFTFPQYTQPRSYRGLEVPEVLLAGNHKEIEQWRAKNRKTRRKKNEKDS